MTDAELIEAAARAIGKPGFYDAYWEGFKSPVAAGEMPDEGVDASGAYTFWNPLVDDGDALRLAVKLKIWIRYRDDASVNACWYDEKGFFAGNVTEEFGSLRSGDEPNAHARRAIVRAAAALTPKEAE
jgi:hypothetical protein